MYRTESSTEGRVAQLRYGCQVGAIGGGGGGGGEGVQAVSDRLSAHSAPTDVTDRRRQAGTDRQTDTISSVPDGHAHTATLSHVRGENRNPHQSTQPLGATGSHWEHTALVMFIAKTHSRALWQKTDGSEHHPL